MRITLINSSYAEKEVIVEAFSELLGHIQDCKIYDNYIEITHSYEDVKGINDLIYTLQAELMEKISAYTTVDSTDEKRLVMEKNLAIRLLKIVSLGAYDIKSILINIDNNFPKKDILEHILEGTGIDEAFIKGFAENDLNVSKAAKVLYLHRNTMLYKLDKLKAVSGFDLRVFKDAYILYSLIEK